MGRLIGVGTGPGDPELLTVKAVKALGEADVLAYFAKAGRSGNGRAVVEGLLKPGLIELPLYYPVTPRSTRTTAPTRARSPISTTLLLTQSPGISRSGGPLRC